jgi:hypothetical protein
MNTYEATLIVLGLFILRLAVPIIVIVGIGYVIDRVQTWLDLADVVQGSQLY